jgi:RNA polymerase sigma-70 factor (ECF subfamily)
MAHLQSLTDLQLVKLYQDGNDNGIETLISRHKQKVFTSIYFLTRNRELSEDLFQETFIKIIVSLRNGRYNEKGKFLSWATMIAHNIVIDHFRMNKRTGAMVRENEEYSPFDIMPENSLNGEQEMIRNEKHERVRKLIEQIPLEQREVLIMRHYGDMSFKEISEALEINLNTCLGRMRYALIKMRDIMAEKGMDLKA